LLGAPKPAIQVVRKNEVFTVPAEAEAPTAKTWSVFVIGVNVPPDVVEYASSPIGFTPEALPAYVHSVGFSDLMLTVHAWFALIVNVGPGSVRLAPLLMLAAVGFVRAVEVELRSRLIRPPTVTLTVCVVVQLVVPEHACCAFRWLAHIAARTIAAHAVGAGFIVLLPHPGVADKERRGASQNAI
jgi:hypothetical protein